jgi:hypothetical protein
MPYGNCTPGQERRKGGRVKRYEKEVCLPRDKAEGPKAKGKAAGDASSRAIPDRFRFFI